MRRNVAWLIAALTMTTGAAWGQMDEGKKGAVDPNGSPHEAHGHDPNGSPHAGPGHDDSDDDDDDAAAPPPITRTPAQIAKRQAVVSERRAAIEAAVHKNGKSLTPAERQAIGVHWRHVMRLLRIRELAEEAKDTATVTRVDALLDKASKHFEGKIAKLNDEAPASAGGAK